ncbi:MAG: UDP-N-acetylmuramoyl-L-alanine--D-glutamate ligase, partial [Candidatus Gracilibacteria bacterium]
MNQRSKIAILGFGLEGMAMLDYLIEHQYPNITVCDKNVDIKHKMPKGVSVALGDEYLNDLERFDVLIRSPGVKWLEPQIQSVLKMGKEVISGTSFFIDHCICPIIGVTGTKGKGTTCSLIYEILKKVKFKVHLGGNIGEPAVGFLDKLKGDHVVVLEMSSFQLQGLSASPKYAILLNTTADHLDYHADVEEYMQAKENLLAHQGKNSLAILNKDYEYVKYYKPIVKGDLRWVSRSEKVDNGAYEKGGEIFYCKKGKCEKVLNVKDIAMIGSHNVENVLCAVAMAKELSVSNKDILYAVKKFKGLPHRLEFVAECKGTSEKLSSTALAGNFDPHVLAVHSGSKFPNRLVSNSFSEVPKGIKFYNDSFSTTPGTSMAAVDSFDVPTVLIAGGCDKGLDYDEWAVKILTKESLRVVILIGKIADK